MGIELKTGQLVKLAKILLKDAEVGCAALAAISEEYTGTEVLRMYEQFQRAADPDAWEADTALDFVMEILGGGS